jgi:hypothetical protein
MLVIISVRRLDNDRIEIGVARPQHDSNPSHNYPSEKEVRGTLSDFGISEETIASHLKLLAQMGTGEQLKFPPMDVPQNELLSREDSDSKRKTFYGKDVAAWQGSKRAG